MGTMSTVTNYACVTVEKDDGLTWVTLNRPDKRNAMSPELDREMLDIILSLEGDPETRVLILTGAGDAFCAGMDLKLYFRALEDKPGERIRAEWVTHQWRWYRLWNFPKPTRHGQRLLHGRRLYPARRLRFCHCCR